MLRGLMLCNAMADESRPTLEYNTKSPAGQLAAELSQVVMTLLRNNNLQIAVLINVVEYWGRSSWCHGATAFEHLHNCYHHNWFVYIVFLIILGNTVVVNSLQQSSVHTASRASKETCSWKCTRNLKKDYRGKIKNTTTWTIKNTISHPP